MRHGGFIPGSLGFTLLEILMSVAILAIIVSIVYATFAGVTETISATRLSVEEVRLRQYLSRSIRTSFASVYVGDGLESDVYRFVGEDDEGPDGPRDRVRFVSSGPLMGGLALPGDLKEVRYDVTGGDSLDTDFEIDRDSDRTSSWGGAGEGEQGINPDQPELIVTETPLLGGNVRELDEETGDFVADPEYESPMWTVPIRSFDVEYFDGTDWVEQWDSSLQAQGYLPWAVHVRINFARSEEQLEEEREAGIDPDEDAEFEMIVTIPAGVGATRIIEEEGDEPSGGEEDGEGSAS